MGPQKGGAARNLRAALGGVRGSSSGGLQAAWRGCIKVGTKREHTLEAAVERRGKQWHPGRSLHADLDAFYASVEQLLDPSMRGKPIAVGGGVVLAASYEAKAFGVRGGMPGRRARELCPQLRFVTGHFSEYQRLGDAAIKILGDFTPLVERLSIDEAFADVAGCEAPLWSAR